MFKMEDVGRRISLMRKNAGLTQMELANRLGISYQAVSNWERGIAMPDISNLGALAGELGVSVDDIIGDKKISSIIEGKPVEEKLTVDEFNTVSPLLEAEKNRELFGKIDYPHSVDSERDRIDLSPLSLTAEEEEKIIRDTYDNGNIAMFAVLKSGISADLAEKLLIKAVRDGNIPFVAMLRKNVSDEARLAAFKEACESGNIALTAILKPKRNEKDDEDEDDDED